MTSTALKVTSHVGRDLLQSAQLFRHEHAVVWEYVSNGLQYKDPNTKPTVIVQIDAKAKSIRISDNGRGMTLADLQRYFQMHGENLDRKQGRPGRGFFGTGKSAAFGIATSLKITTVRNKRLSEVHLTRSDIEARSDGDEIPVKIIQSEVKTTTDNGTLVEIEHVFLRSIDIGSIIRHIERHIVHWPNAIVIVNNHECAYVEPDFSEERKISTIGTEFEQRLGLAELIVKVAKAPLEDELRGVAILSDGIWHETTLAGCDRKPFAEYLFGAFKVEALSKDKSAPSAFDMSRSMKLNPRNETVAEIIRFVGMNLEFMRRELEQKDRERRKSEEQRRLQEQGSKIAELINQHFKEWSTKLRSTLAKSGVGKDFLPKNETPPELNSKITLGDELLGNIIKDSQGEITAGSGSKGNADSSAPKRIELDETSARKIAKRTLGETNKSATGGFNVAFDKIGINEKRAKYDRDTRTIYVNLEHPRIAMELKDAKTKITIDDPNFLRMAYEIAFTEYSIVLAQELSGVQYYFDPQDALVEVRQTLDDLSKAFASSWTTRSS